MIDYEPKMPLCTNIMRLQAYLFSPDEVILFDWFIVKQVAFKYQEFHYSQARIEKETRIKRTRQDSIISYFEEMGFLSSKVKENKITHGRVRYFKVSFQALMELKLLSEIIKKEDPLYLVFVEYIRHHTIKQNEHNARLRIAKGGLSF